MNLCKKRCDQCLFSSARIVGAKRKSQIIAECLRYDRHFICHKAQPGEDRVCRGFYDNYPGVGQLVRIMGRLGALKEVEP